ASSTTVITDSPGLYTVATSSETAGKIDRNRPAHPSSTRTLLMRTSVARTGGKLIWSTWSGGGTSGNFSPNWPTAISAAASTSDTSIRLTGSRLTFWDGSIS